MVNFWLYNQEIANQKVDFYILTKRVTKTMMCFRETDEDVEASKV